MEYREYLNMYLPAWLEPWKYRYSLRYERVNELNVTQTRAFQVRPLSENVLLSSIGIDDFSAQLHCIAF